MERETEVLRQLAKGAGTSFLFGLIGYVLVFFYKLLAARYFGAEQLGVYSLVETIFYITSLFAVIGVSGGIPRYLPLYETEKKYELLTGYLRYIFRIPIILSLLLIGILWLSAEDITSFFNFPDELTTFIKLIALALPCNVISRSIRGIFVAKKKMVYNGMGYLVVEKVTLCIGIVLIMFLKLSLWWLVFTFLCSMIAGSVYDVVTYYLKIRLPSVKNAIFHRKEWFLFSVPLFFTSVFSYVINWTDKLVVGKMLSAGELGMYSVAQSLGGTISFFETAFTTIFIPLIVESYARKENEKISLLFKKAGSWIMGLGIAPGLVLIVFSSSVIDFLYGEQYVKGYLILIVLASGFLITNGLGLSSQVLMLHKKTKWIFYINLGTAIMNIILSIVFVAIWGFVGAAIATAITLMTRNVISLLLARKYEKLDIDWIFYGKAMLAGGIGVGIVKVSFNAVEISWFWIATMGLVYLLIYSVLLVVFKSFKEEDIMIISAIEKKMKINLSFIKNVMRS